MNLVRIALLSSRKKALLTPIFTLVMAGLGLFGESFLQSSSGQSPAAVPPMQAMTNTPTATATSTALPTPTPLPTMAAVAPSPTATPDGWDSWEPNNSLEEAKSITVNQTISDLTLAPADDVDYFLVYGKADQILNVTTFVKAGTDTILRLYSQAGVLLQENDDKSPTDLGSAILWTSAEDDWLIVSVGSAIPGYGGEYDLSIMLESPTPTPPPQPTQIPPTAVPTQTTTPPPVSADEYEPNNNIDAAAEIVMGTNYQATLPGGDVDYYRLLAKDGNRYQCSTVPNGVDTAVTIYNGALEILAENDDRAPDDIGSSATWRAEQTGDVYIAVQGRAGRGEYTLACDVALPPTPVPYSGGGNNNAAAAPATATPVPTATPVELTVRYLGEAQPTATPVIETVVRLVVVYDKNNSRAGDIGEGIQNVSVRALYGGRVVAWGLTDERGEVTLRIIGDVERITIPYFNFWEMSVNPGSDLEPRTVVIPPVQLPVILPVETPSPEEN
ncbi:MAG: hypothetical protein GY803_10250 [Chloroflexi bacterium]|nr:hypothetical protein [Chloroflexota bacterium]